VASVTLLAIEEFVAGSLGKMIQGTLNDSATALLTAAVYPFITNRANASDRRYVGAEFMSTQASTGADPNPNGLGAYDASAGTWVPSMTYATKPGTTDTFSIFFAPVTHEMMRRNINKALRNRRYLTVVPLTLVDDGDMETSGTGSWTDTNATISKVTTAGNVLRGSQSLRVLATSALGQAQSGTINVDPVDSQDYYLEAKLRAAVGTGRLIAYDVTNSADIETEDHTEMGFGRVGFTFTLPSTCEQLAVRLVSVANSDDAYWDDVILLRQGAREMPLPANVETESQVRYVFRSWGEQLDHDAEITRTYYHWDFLPNLSNANNQWSLKNLSPVINGPIWVELALPFAELTAITDTTFMFDSWIYQAALVETLSELINLASGSEVLAWRAELRRQMPPLIMMDDLYRPDAVIRDPWRSPPRTPIAVYR